MHLTADPDLRRKSVVILTTSDSETYMLETYDLHANCYIAKPVSFDRFTTVLNDISNFWLAVVKIPRK